MSKTALTRTNLLLERQKVRRLREVLQSRSNSEAVRLVIDERLAVEAGLQALRRLRKRGGIDDVFGRAPRTDDPPSGRKILKLFHPPEH